MATLRRKITLSVLTVLVLGIAVFVYALSHDAPCASAPALTPGSATMKAVVRRCYGPPAVLTVENVQKPVPAADEMLVRVYAAAINPLDWHRVRGTPYVMRLGEGLGVPKDPRVGLDFAGTVEAVGKDVTKFKPGDAIFGGRSGALAEYVTVREGGSIALKPANVDFEEAAAVYVAALTALQALRDRAAVQPGDKVLINGASGGVGTFAVQIAKWLGAEVTGVCSTRNVELVRSLGADHVIDYKKADFTTTAQRYDVVMDNVVNRPILEIRPILEPQGKYLVIGGGGPDAGSWIHPFVAPIKAEVISWFVEQDMAFFLSHASAEDVATLAGLMEQGRVRPVVDRTYPMGEIVAAMTYLESGRARGKVVIMSGY